MIPHGIAAAEGIPQRTRVGRSLQWHDQEYLDDQWYEEAYGAAK